jgi:hypothetical protein
MPWQKVMGKFKAGHLHSGSKHGPEVKSREQAIAIMMSEKRAAAKGKKYDKGGLVEKTGPATLQKGELVVPADHPAFDQILALFQGNEQAEEQQEPVAPMPSMMASAPQGRSIAGGS